MARRKRKKEEPEENEKKSRSLTDRFRRKARKPQSIEEALGTPPGPYDRPGFITGWTPGPGGQLVPYEIRLPSPEYRCPVDGQEFATAEFLELHRRANHPRHEEDDE